MIELIVKKLDKLLNRSLKIYEKADIYVQQKVKILNFFLLSSILTLPLSIIFALIYKPESLPFYFLLTSGIFILIFVRVLLIRGYHKAVSHLVLFICFTGIWGGLFASEGADTLSRLDNIFFLFPSLVFIPFLLSGKKISIFFYYGMNCAIYIIFINYITTFIQISDEVAFKHASQTLFVIFLIYIVSFGLFKITRNILMVARDEAEKNARLNAILEQKVVERTAQLERFKSFVDTSNQGFGIADFEGNILYINKSMAKILKIEDSVKVIGRNWAEFYTPKILEILEEQILPSVKNKGEWKGQLPMKTIEGDLLLTENSYFVMKDNRGGKRYIANAMADITQWVSTVKELEDMSKIVEQTSRLAGTAEVATGALHNVGNILSSVGSASSRLKDEIARSRMEGIIRLSELVEHNKENLDEFLTSDKGKNVLAYIKALAENFSRERETLLFQMNDLMEKVEHMAAVVRFQQDYSSGNCSKEFYDMNDIITGSVKMVEEYAVKRNVTLDVSLKDSFKGYFNQNCLVQILVNLFRNAVQALKGCDREEKRVSVCLRILDDTYIALDVKDNGRGISAENIKKIFEYGFTTRKEGHGYGLSYCFKTAARMGGDLSVSSPGEGKGACFTLKIPYVQRKIESSEEPPV